MKHKRLLIYFSIALIISASGLVYCSPKKSTEIQLDINSSNNGIYRTALKFSEEVTWVYDSRYYTIPYPNGDVPSGGACTDVVIRVLRKNGIDLQQQIHEDMRAHFAEYPKKWGLGRPDPNIDHRRVPNIMTYFNRKGYNLPVTSKLRDYHPGDIITWELSPGITHIGVLLDGERVFHNIGPVSKTDAGFLFKYPIIGHYRIL